MKRLAEVFLEEWLSAPRRKPLIVRGARQVGKTWLVHHLAEIHQKQLIEINFEKNPKQAEFFASNDPKQILFNLSTFLQQNIDVTKALLFLDEIQAAPEILAKLRWFAEDMPELPVIAAGSLLEFVLENHTFSMPVGRISYMYLEPLSFEEFLLALNKRQLYDYLQQYHWDTKIPEIIHEQLMGLFKEYTIVGGMPAAVFSWVNEHSLIAVNKIHHHLISTYRDDFSKYNTRIASSIIDDCMMRIPSLLGKKFTYSKVNPALDGTTVKKALALLNKAKICHGVVSCAANGLPLAAELNHKYFKEIFVDVGLCGAALGLTLNHVSSLQDIMLINSGGIAEQLVGQQLRTIYPPYIEPALYYWQRSVGSSNSEIDYVIQYAHYIVPIEVKAGSSGTLKSLHLFMRMKQLATAIRINSDFPSKTFVDVKDSTGIPIKYTLLSLPFYLLNQLQRLVEVAGGQS